MLVDVVCVGSETLFGARRRNHGMNTSSSGWNVPSLLVVPFGLGPWKYVFVPIEKPIPTTGSPVSRIFVQPYCGAVGVNHGSTQLFTNGSSAHSAISCETA